MWQPRGRRWCRSAAVFPEGPDASFAMISWRIFARLVQDRSPFTGEWTAVSNPLTGRRNITSSRVASAARDPSDQHHFGVFGQFLRPVVPEDHAVDSHGNLTPDRVAEAGVTLCQFAQQFANSARLHMHHLLMIRERSQPGP